MQEALAEGCNFDSIFESEAGTSPKQAAFAKKNCGNGPSMEQHLLGICFHSLSGQKKKDHAMHDRKLEKYEWSAYFENVSYRLQGRWFETEVAESDTGSRVATRWVPLDDLSYDSEADVFSVHTELVRRSISRPTDIFVIEDETSISSVFIRDANRHLQAIRLRAPLILAALRL
jgi:hypothetical protein